MMIAGALLAAAACGLLPLAPASLGAPPLRPSTRRSCVRPSAADWQKRLDQTAARQSLHAAEAMSQEAAEEAAVAYDDVSGASLDPARVLAARREEMRFVRDPMAWWLDHPPCDLAVLKDRVRLI